MDEALGVRRARVAADLLAIEGEQLEIGLGHQLRAERPRDDVPVGMVRVSDADVAEGVDDALVGQDAVGEHQVSQQLGVTG